MTTLRREERNYRNANQELSEGSEEGVSLDDEAVWQEEGSGSLLRNRQQARQGQVQVGSRPQRVQEEEALDDALLEAARRRRDLTNGVTTINRHWHITKMKWCFGPLHPPGGELLPCDPDGESAFYMNKVGKKAGRPFSHCKQCEHLKRGVDPANSGFVSVAEGRAMANYVADRIGRTEFLRRADLAQSFFARLEEYPTMRMATLNRIRRVYHAVRAAREQRAPNDIKYGAYLRGRAESRKRAKAELDQGGWETYLAYVAERNAAKSPEPDPKWWVNTGMEWVPRYGEEMLGSDF